jgi:hypothetical protein
MPNRNPFGILALCGLVFLLAAGLFQIFHIRLLAGDLYPAWSSRRSDPDGTRLLFDSLAATSRVVTVRQYKPLAQSPRRNATVLFLGYSPGSLVGASDAELAEFEQSARAGNRVVLALNQRQWSTPPEQKTESPLAKRWGVDLDRVPAKFEDEIELFFSNTGKWDRDVIEKKRPVVIERAFGSGTIVLAANSAVFSNQSLALNRNSALLLRLIGPNARVVFDESHLGVQDTGSVLGLVHKYRLDGLLWGLLAVALIFVWSHAVGFPPPAPATGRAPTAGNDSRLGLAQLLRRQIPLSRVINVCFSEWQRTNTRTKLPPPASQPDPLEAYRHIQQELTSQ